MNKMKTDFKANKANMKVTEKSLTVENCDRSGLSQVNCKITFMIARTETAK
jgi:hypothetical protein